MNDNIKENIISKAWEIIQEDTKIKKFYFIPWLISIIFLMIILVYQVIYTYVELFHQKDKALSIILGVFHSGYFSEIIIIWTIFLVFYIIIIPIFEWGLIWYISKKQTLDTYVSISDSFWNGLYRFLPLFEYGNIFAQFKFISLINIYLFCLRFIWIKYMLYLTYVFLFLLIISTIVNILFAYTRFEIVLNNKKALEAISQSIKISILNLATTTKIYFFMFLVNIRIIINFLVFLFFPFLIASAITFITTKTILIITVFILSIIFIVLILILWYLWSVFEIFKTSLRYYAYIEWKKKLKDADWEHEHWNTKEK